MAEGKDNKEENTTGLEGETVSTKKPPHWKRLWEWTGFGEKRLWDWLQMLVVPLLVALIGVLFAAVQQAVQQDARQLALEDRRASAQLQIEEQRAQEVAIQTYLDAMRDLLLDEGLKASEPGSSVRAVANAQTLATLRRLDGVRKRVVLQFLYESSLIQKDRPIVHLSTAPLEGIDLRRVTMRNVNLSGAQLSEADLQDADLQDANVTDEQLADAMSLKGATMPNGQKYEDWLKDKEGSAEEGKNSGSS